MALLRGRAHSSNGSCSTEGYTSKTLQRRLHSFLVVVGAAVFLLVVILSMVVFRLVRENMYQQAEEKFTREVASIQRTLQVHLDEHVQILNSAKGLFLASEEVKRDEWNALVEGLNVWNRYPGIAFMAYIEQVEQAKKYLFEQQVRFDTSIAAEGYPEFRIYPEGEREEYAVVKYIVSRDGDEQFLGWDVEESRRTNLQRVRDAGEPSYVGRINIDGTEQDYLFVLPIYQNGVLLDSVRKRRNAHLGFVALGLRPSLFLSSQMFLREDVHVNFALELLDEQEHVLHQQSFPRGLAFDELDNALTSSTFLHASGLVWVLRVRGPRTFSLDASQVKLPQLILLGGWGFSLLAFTIFYLVANSRMRALRLARRMTSELGKFQLAVKHASNHIIITDPDGTILYANPAVEGLTGFSREEVVGKTPRLWGGQMDHNFYARFWKHIKEDKEPFDGEIVNKRKDGTRYDAVIHVSPILDHQSHLFGFVGIEEDITKRKELERARSEFVSLASHQLRTPLTAMRLALDTLIAGAIGPIPDDQRALLLRTKEYGVHMAETIFTMLTISHIEAGRVTVEPTDVILSAFFAELQREYSPEMKRKNQNFTIQSPEGATLKIDEKLLREIMANLLSNATKYTPEGGKIAITVTEEGGELRVDVSDTGCGIPAYQQDRVFQKFFRGENVIKRSTNGTGLGLYLVQSLTTLLQGRVAFASQEDEGTTFSLFLPITPPVS